MLKVCLATSYTRALAQIGVLCTSTMKNYAQKYGYVLRVVTDFVLEDRWPAWHKIQFIRELLNEDFDVIFWMDTDALLVRYDRDIREVVEPGKDLYLVCHAVPTPAGIQELPNTGVMLWRNCEWSKDFLEEIWNHEEYLYRSWWENAALLDLLGYSGFLEQGENQMNWERLDHVQFIGLEWNSLPHVAGCSASRPIIRHYAGMDMPGRIRLMTQDYVRSSLLFPEKEALARGLSRVKKGVLDFKPRFHR